MLKKSPNRGQRTKGKKLRNILQIGLLLGVCFWLIYQVKHSHDKRKEHDGRVAEISNSEQNSNVVRLGRKDLHPRVEKAKNDKLEEEEDNEEEIRTQEVDNKRLAEAREVQILEHDLRREEDDDEESKNDDSEDEGRGGGDDEIDEHDQEQNEGEIDRDEEFIDEEKEREEEENEKEADETENEESEIENERAEDQDNDGNSKSTHEAREENYKADDASSEVAHDTQIKTNDLGSVRLNISNGDQERNILAQNDTSNNTAVSLKRNKSNSGVVEGATSGNDGSFSLKNEETLEVSLSSPLNSSLTNLTTESHLNDQPDTSNSPEHINAELISNSTHILTTTLSQLNPTENPSGILRAEKKEVLDNPKTGQALNSVSIEPDLTNNVNISSGSNQSNLNFTIFSETKISEATIVDTSNSSASTEFTLSEKDMGSKSTSKIADSYWSTTVKEGASTALRKLSSNDVDPIRTKDSTVSAFLNESEDAIQHDSSNFSIHEGKKEVRAGLGDIARGRRNNNSQVDTE